MSLDPMQQAAVEVPGSFVLEISFSGLSVFAPDGDELLVLQPDARQNRSSADVGPLRHLDGMMATAHAGFMTLDLQHLQPGAASCEVVVQFDREVVRFDGLPKGKVRDALDLPDFSRFAPVMQLDASLRGDAPREELLARVHLTGGELTPGAGDDLLRMVSRVLTSDTYLGHQQVSDTFAHVVTYSAQIDAKHVTATITPFGGGSAREFRLHPLNGKVSLRISNLCAENPMEWRSLLGAPREGEDDMDFKWLSQLFVVRDGQRAPDFTKATPVPYLKLLGDRREGLISNCWPARGEF